MTKSDVKIAKIEYAGKADVFNMEVEDGHSFIVNGGIITHNCYDECRYFCMMNPVPAESYKPKNRKEYNPF